MTPNLHICVFVWHQDKQIAETKCVNFRQVICDIFCFPATCSSFPFGCSQVSHFPPRPVSQESRELGAGYAASWLVSKRYRSRYVWWMNGSRCDSECDHLTSATWSNCTNEGANQMAVLMGWAHPPNDSLRHDLKLHAWQMQGSAGYCEPSSPGISRQHCARWQSCHFVKNRNALFVRKSEQRALLPCTSKLTVMFTEPATFTAVQTYSPASSGTVFSMCKLPSLLRKTLPLGWTWAGKKDIAGVTQEHLSLRWVAFSWRK